MSARLAGKSAAQNQQASINAENERARLAGKRQAYVRFLTASGDLINSMARQQALAADADTTLGTALVYEHGAALAGVLNTLGELLLIAPQTVMGLADSGPDDNSSESQFKTPK